MNWLAIILPKIWNSGINFQSYPILAGDEQNTNWTAFLDTIWDEIFHEQLAVTSPIKLAPDLLSNIKDWAT